MEKKYQVFISSTYIDLIEERKAVTETLLSADCIPAGMEAFCAEDDEQFNVIKKVIDLCDYYILILGKRYGSINSETHLSYTEMEYDYALSRGVPILVFPIDGRMGKDPDEDEMANNLLKLFKIKVSDKRLTSGSWKNAEELSKQVALAMPKIIARKKRPGWVRGDAVVNLEHGKDNSKKIDSVLELFDNNDSDSKQKAQYVERALGVEGLTVLYYIFDSYKKKIPNIENGIDVFELTIFAKWPKIKELLKNAKFANDQNEKEKQAKIREYYQQGIDELKNIKIVDFVEDYNYIDYDYYYLDYEFEMILENKNKRDDIMNRIEELIQEKVQYEK